MCWFIPQAEVAKLLLPAHTCVDYMEPSVYLLLNVYWTIYSFLRICNKIAEKSGKAVVEEQNELQSSSKPLKEKTTKAERRALQEAQRAAKAAAKGSRIELMCICYYMIDYQQLIDFLHKLTAFFLDLFSS
jgi:hypothetical protein